MYLTILLLGIFFATPQASAVKPADAEVQSMMDEMERLVTGDKELNRVARIAKEYGFEVWMQGRTVESLMNHIRPYADEPEDFALANKRRVHLVVKGTEFHREMLADFANRLNETTSLYWAVDLASPDQIQALSRRKGQTPNPAFDHFPALALHCRDCERINPEMIRFYLENRHFHSPKSSPTELLLSLKWLKKQLEQKYDRFTQDQFNEVEILLHQYDPGTLNQDQLLETHELISAIRRSLIERINEIQGLLARELPKDMNERIKMVFLVGSILKPISENVREFYWQVDSLLAQNLSEFTLNLAKTPLFVEEEMKRALSKARAGECQLMFD